MNAREQILATLRAQSLEPVALPELTGGWIQYPDPFEQFQRALARAAGSTVSTVPRELRSALAELPVVRAARHSCSLLPALEGNVPLPSEPHGFRDLDVLLVPALFGVAENGALWLAEQTACVRAGLFLTQHLVVLLERANIVHNLHQAYERIGADVGRTGYGCFISGPSKTADIEQALVVGAHGPRSLTVVVSEG